LPEMGSNQPPVLTTPLRDYTVPTGATLVFTNTATDPNYPPQPLAFLLDLDAPEQATLDRNTGVFTWTAPNSPATHRFTIWATETSEPFLRDSATFTIATVAGPRAIRFVSIQRGSANSITVIWQATPGTQYQLQYKNDLNAANWQGIGEAVSATSDTVSQTDPNATASQRYYRVLQASE
jgi:hypothetical protein